MNDKKRKKQTAKMLHEFGMPWDDSRRLAHQTLQLDKDMATFQNPPIKDSTETTEKPNVDMNKFIDAFHIAIATASQIPISILTRRYKK